MPIGIYKRPSAEERFADKVMPEPNSGCFLWTGAINYDGYGHFNVGDQKIVRAHRYAFEREFHDVPEDMCLDHLCRVRSCVNPLHLEVVTKRENILRGLRSRGKLREDS